MRCFVRFALVYGFALAAFAQTPPARFQIRWDTNHSSVSVIGPISDELQKVIADKPEEAFTVSVEPANVLAAINLPPILGSYTSKSDAIDFQARFPFEPGITYRATFAPAKLSSTLAMPREKENRTTIVSQVFPTADVLPQNLLKFYLHFSAPMSRGHIYEHIQLLSEDGSTVELPFLEIDEELWNPEMTRLTLFLDPGRIKRGVRPLEEVGPALYPNKSYTLVIDDRWQDARGIPLKAGFRKAFRVTPPDREAPDPHRWTIIAPKAQTRDPVMVTFAHPMDEALALRMISVRSVTGQKSLREHETQWLFSPDQPWAAGRYQILVQSTIEDLAGNNIGKPFEVDLEQGDQPRDPVRTISLWFEVK
jgi:hypothetical protein